jgi:hypothetical protein
MFVPWEHFLSESSGDVNAIWKRKARLLPRRLVAMVGNIQLLRRSAEDAKRDAKQWAAQSREEDVVADATEVAAFDGEEHENEGLRRLYIPDGLGSVMRVIDVLRSAMGSNQITAGSSYVRCLVQQLCAFQQATLDSTEDVLDTVIDEQGDRTLMQLKRVRKCLPYFHRHQSTHNRSSDHGQ